MPQTSPARRRLAATLGALGTAAALVAVVGTQLVQADSIQPVTTGGTSSTGTTGVTADPNDYTCTGQLRAGAPEAGTPGTQVQYRFSCNGPITGYQIDTEPHQIEYSDASPVLTINDAPSTDNFECEGITPGPAINCVGASTAPGEVITGQFSIAGKLTTEPEVDAILTVTDATATATATATAPIIKVTTAQTESSTGLSGSTTVTPKPTATVTAVTVTDAISGPFDLGRPVNVKHDEFSSDTRLGSTPPVEVLVTKSKSGAWITTLVPLDGTTSATGVGGAPKAHHHHKKSSK